MKTMWIWVAAILAGVAAGCGGGGGGSDGPGKVTITAQNAEEVAGSTSELYAGLGEELDPDSILAMATGDFSGAAKTLKRLGKATAPRHSALGTVDVSDDFYCQVGSATVTDNASASLEPGDVGYTARLELKDCGSTEGDWSDEVSGWMEVTVTAATETSLSLRVGYSVTDTWAEAGGQNETSTVSASFDLVTSQAGSLETAAFTGLDVSYRWSGTSEGFDNDNSDNDNSGGLESSSGSGWVRGALVLTRNTLNGNASSDFDGSYYDSEMGGTVEVETTAAFTTAGYDYYPSSGSAVITGAGAKLTMTAEDDPSTADHEVRLVLDPGTGPILTTFEALE